jgi:rhodanese-related sulfurtransferase/DNA-directed RNA polymerase subunit RPC12/RpoP
MRKIAAIFFVTTTLFILLTAEKCISNKEVAEGEVSQNGIYVCLPCGSACDTIQYKTTGTCSHCSMALVKKSTITHTDVEPEEMCSFIDKAGNKNVLLLDVRTAEEFEGKAEQKFGRLKDAVNIPVQQLEQRMNELVAWKNKRIIVYCSHSHRSPRASYMLTQKGFKKVTNMQGGMSVWKARVSDEQCNNKIYIAQ